jgi:hypothetical protein
LASSALEVAPARSQHGSQSLHKKPPRAT